MNKKIIVTDKKLLKEGEKNGRKWQLVAIVDENGDRYTTFNSDRYEEGKVYEIAYEEKQVEKGGKVYKDRRIIDNQQRGGNQETLLLLRAIDAKLNEVIEFIKTK